MRRLLAAGDKMEAVDAEVVTGGTKLALAASSPRSLLVPSARAVCCASKARVVTGSASQETLAADVAVSLALEGLLSQRSVSSCEATLPTSTFANALSAATMSAWRRTESCALIVSASLELSSEWATIAALNGIETGSHDLCGASSAGRALPFAICERDCCPGSRCVNFRCCC